jgi:hypothetical protein
MCETRNRLEIERYARRRHRESRRLEGNRRPVFRAAPGRGAFHVGVRIALSGRLGPAVGGRRAQRGLAAMLPPSTVTTDPVVLWANANATNACATSSAVTSRPNKFAL